MIGSGKETYADSTLKKMKKDELIDIIRMLEKNIESVEWMNDNQYQLLNQMSLDLRFYKTHDLVNRRDILDILPYVDENIVEKINNIPRVELNRDYYDVNK